MDARGRRDARQVRNKGRSGRYASAPSACSSSCPSQKRAGAGRDCLPSPPPARPCLAICEAGGGCGCARRPRPACKGRAESWSPAGACAPGPARAKTPWRGRDWRRARRSRRRGIRCPAADREPPEQGEHSAAAAHAGGARAARDGGGGAGAGTRRNLAGSARRPAGRSLGDGDAPAGGNACPMPAAPRSRGGCAAPYLASKAWGGARAAPFDYAAPLPLPPAHLGAIARRHPCPRAPAPATGPAPSHCRPTACCPPCRGLACEGVGRGHPSSCPPLPKTLP